MSDQQPRDLTDEEINEAGPEDSKQASSPLYATKEPSLVEDVEPDEEGDEDEAGGAAG